MKSSTYLTLIGLPTDTEIVKCSKCSCNIKVGRFSVTFGKPTTKRLIRSFFKPFQCQDCGKIKFDDPETNFPDELKNSFKGECVALKIKCDCGGQFRRDKNLFCTNCHYRKSSKNRFYKNISIYKKTVKKLLLILFCLPMIGFGQTFGSIFSFSISPVNPNNTDTVYIYTELWFCCSNCSLDMKSHSVVGNNIVASAQHCLGNLSAICNTTDTFKLNPLAVGTYTFDLTLYSGFGSSPCTAGISPDDNDVFTFDVVTSVGIEEHTTNKKLFKVTDLFGRETKQTNQLLFYIYDDGTVEKKLIVE